MSQLHDEYEYDTLKTDKGLFYSKKQALKNKHDKRRKHSDTSGFVE